MSEFCHIVPWYNNEEWHKVYDEISSSSTNKENALNTLLVWKARCPSLPSGIESTLTLLQVHVEDLRQSQDVTDDQLIRLAYSSAVMRFVNHMLDTETVKGSSLYRAAKNLGVPEWIVDLRHDTAHSNNLPHIALLREACTISLQWLQKNYWDKYKTNIQDYISGQKDIVNSDMNKISELIHLATSLSICAHPNCKIKNVLQIPNIEMRESIVNDVQDLFGDSVDLSNLKTVSIKSLINLLCIESKKLLNISNVTTYVNEAMLGEDSLFLSQELLYFFSANEFKHKNRLTNSYVQCFQVLISFLHSNDLLLDFILALIKITQNGEVTHFKARLSAVWVSEILLAVKRSQKFSEKLKRMIPENKAPKKKDLKQLYYDWFPSTKGKSLILELQKPIPVQLLDINFIQPIIAAYNPYLIYFVRNLLNLIEPSIPSSVAERVYKLAELISAPEKFPLSMSALYTVDDLIANVEDDDIKITGVIEPEEVDVIREQDSEETITNSIWRLASNNHKWSSCPIGQLPWQQENDIVMKDCV